MWADTIGPLASKSTHATRINHSLTYPLVHLLTHPLTHKLTHSSTHSPTHKWSLTHSPIQVHVHSPYLQEWRYWCSHWVLQTCNNWSNEHQLAAIQVPDVDPAYLPQYGLFSMAAGDFLEVYTEQLYFKIFPIFSFFSCKKFVNLFSQDKESAGIIHAEDIQGHAELCTIHAALPSVWADTIGPLASKSTQSVKITNSVTSITHSLSPTIHSLVPF